MSSDHPDTPTLAAGHAAPELRRRLAAVRLYLVTDAGATAERTLEVVEAAIAGGVDAIQLRRKGDDALEQLRLARRCRELCAEEGVLFIVNDRLDVAMAVEADGVHLGQADLPLAEARRLWPGRLAGRSTHAPEQARAAVAEGADYLGVGPVYATPTKPGADAVGLEYVRWAMLNVAVPWVAIGGIDTANAGDVVAAGADAIAVVRAICAAADPEAATRRLRDAIRAAAVVAT
jgi:thiamine-phosphate pyrophosphorylase